MLQNSSIHIRKYLDQIETKYNAFRYHSDHITLSRIDDVCFSHIEKEIIADDRGFGILFCDDRISSEVGFIGFFELYQVSDKMDFIQYLIEKAKEKGYKRLIAPVNLSIWGSYRFSHISSNPAIYGEYLTDPGYPDIFLKTGFSKYEGYTTAYRESNPFITLNELEDNLEVDEIPQEIQDEVLFGLSSKIFVGAPKISKEEFDIYMQVYKRLYTKNMHIFGLRFNGSYIGFASTFYDEKSFIIKTIGILDVYRGKGYGNHFLSHIHSFYEHLSIKKAFYLFMRESGDALDLTHKDAKYHRSYSTYIFHLS